MNYITQLNAFYNLAGSLELSSSARMLYLSLLQKNNNLAWSKSFTCTASELNTLGGLSPSSIQRARQQLVDKQLIEYKKRGSNRAPRYSIYELDNKLVLTILGDTPNDSANYTAGDTPNDTAKTLTKLKQTKTNIDDDDDLNNAHANDFNQLPVEIKDQWSENGYKELNTTKESTLTILVNQFGIQRILTCLKRMSSEEVDSPLNYLKTILVNERRQTT